LSETICLVTHEVLFIVAVLDTTSEKSKLICPKLRSNNY